MSLKSSNKVDTNVWELEVSVDGDTFKDAVTKAYLKQRKNITIPGFRKGKAPRAFIEKYYGEGVFYEDALEAIYPDAVASAIEEAKLEPVDTPYDLEIPEMGNDGVTMKFKVTVKPEVELGEYKGLKATKKSTKVTADEVKAELARMQEQNSTVSDVDDRAVKKNDIVVIDFEGFVDGKAFEGGKAEKYELTIGSNQFIPGFEDQIIGHKIGDKFDVNVKFPEDYQADLASKDAVFKIKLHGIKVKEVPALDDEFAKDVSEFDTLDELKKDIKKQLEKRKNDDAENELHNTLLEEVAKGIKAEIPEAMIEKTIDDDVNEYSYCLQSQGLKLETYLKYTGMDMKGFREGFKERAETQVRLNLRVSRKTRPQHKAPTMLPGKARRLPIPSRLRIRLAQKAMPIPHHGPSMTAAKTLTICWTGAHLLPATGTLIRLPATAAAVSTPAMASF